ncbi:MAG: prepilin-type N-terminal cleavage/methylation domain-containing protein [Myxococcota bacterium]
MTPAAPARAIRAARHALARGFTLIEMMVTIAIIVTLIAVGAIALGSMRAADADTTANVLAGAMRYVSTLAVHYNKTYRLVLDLDKHRWWAETTNTDDPCGRFVPDDADPPKSAEEALADGTAPPKAKAKNADGEEIDPELGMGASFTKEEAELLDGEFEPETTVSAVLTDHHQEPQTHGKVAIYFYPNGQAERAFVWVAEEKDEDGVVTAVPEITLSLEGLGTVQRFGAVLDENEFYREAKQ